MWPCDKGRSLESICITVYPTVEFIINVFLSPLYDDLSNITISFLKIIIINRIIDLVGVKLLLVLAKAVIK